MNQALLIEIFVRLSRGSVLLDIPRLSCVVCRYIRERDCFMRLWVCVDETLYQRDQTMCLALLLAFRETSRKSFTDASLATVLRVYIT